jgi:hypothetical protein
MISDDRRDAQKLSDGIQAHVLAGLVRVKRDEAPARYFGAPCEGRRW